MLPTAFITTALLIDASALRIEIDERELRLRGLLGIFRKTIPIDEIESFLVSDSWSACHGMIHFTIPAKGCIQINRRKGWSISFSTNQPEEIAMVLATLGVPRALRLK
ncbi:hypothetical protein PYCH_06530 [Pyrococcus yayanosii CH1]|uniref:Uncharacterized protein n=2 Tax=Pyrococcus TaxID=2260 RepID=F8AJ14_PYRYC|nr:hypothetical protein PYCH_06530 [Pyrococcus yayanosii CH1]